MNLQLIKKLSSSTTAHQAPAKGEGVQIQQNASLYLLNNGR